VRLERFDGKGGVSKLRQRARESVDEVIGGGRVEIGKGEGEVDYLVEERGVGGL